MGKYDPRYADNYDDRYANIDEYEDQPQQYQALARRDQGCVPARRQASAFGQRQSRELPGGHKIQDEIRLRGARYIRRAQRVTSRSYWPWGGVRREVIVEDLFEGDFFDQGFDDFDD